MKRTVTLTETEIQNCREFAKKCAKTQQAIEFGQADTAERSFAESERDILIGKLAEVAVAKMLKTEFGIEASLDFSVYPRGIWDSNDLIINGWNIDIKSTRTGKWFLIEWNKLYFRDAEGKMPHAFIPCRTEWDMEHDIPRNKVEIEGFITTEEILRSTYHTVTMRKGTCIPGTAAKLQADNYGILFDNIPNDWNAVAARLSEKPPRSVSMPAQGESIAWAEAKVQAPENSYEIEYSLLTTDNSLLFDEKKIDGLLNHGIKVTAFCSRQQKAVLERNRDLFVKANLLQLHTAEQNLPILTIADGEGAANSTALKKVSSAVPSFNYEQYIIEHAPKDQHLIIEAGAGTGKTTVMIDRIFFLISMVPDLHFEDIAMITFTNEATQNMKRRIESSIKAKYTATHSPKFLRMLEDSSKLNISTIHSFSRKLLNGLGSKIGYGESPALRGYRYEKQQLVRRFLDSYFQKMKKYSVEDIIGGSLHDIEELLLQYWAKLDNIGLTDREISTLDWGESADAESAPLHDVIRTAFSVLPGQYNELKLENDAIAVDDIIRELRRILALDDAAAPVNEQIKYLFVDEFQDTDNAQISAIAWLTKNYGLTLFAVGDIKQSIYRFRGAVETAFEKLRTALMETAGIRTVQYSLIRNYRTSPHVMSEIDRICRKLERAKLLDYGKSLMPQRNITGSFEIRKVQKSADIPLILPDMLRKAAADCAKNAEQNHTAGKESHHATVLARTNYQIATVGEICRAEKIPCYIQREGTLYTSRAAADLYSVLRAYVFPESCEALFSYLASPYSSAAISFDLLRRYSPGSKEMAAFLQTQLEPSGFSYYLKNFRILPAFAVIRELTESDEILHRYGEERRAAMSDWKEADREEQIRIDCAQYSADLEEILYKLKERFSGEMASLSNICDNLKLSILTNRSDDEPDITGVSGPGCIYGMTVHKAKGLEFDTVILPYTTKTYRRAAETELLIDEKATPMRASWCTAEWADIYKTVLAGKKCSSYYESAAADEMHDTDKEEARLLYVAMTRAIRCLTIIEPTRVRPHTWASLLEV